MPKKSDTNTDDLADLPEVGHWAHEKLDRLGKYLSAYTKIMSKQPWAKGYVYIDAFAGGGRARIRDTHTEDQSYALELGQNFRQDREAREVLDGSPRVALEVNPPFTLYVFLESDSKRLRSLEDLKNEYAGRRQIRIREGDCNHYLIERVRKVDWTEWRGVVFLDPFGMQVPWKTISLLAGTRAIEAFLNFPIGMSIQRLLKKDGKFSDKERRKLDDYFGDPSWFDVVYQERRGLFGPAIVKNENANRLLLNWYCERLRKTFGHASQPYLVVNSKRGHLYYLIFAGPNKPGARIASHVLKGGAKAK